MRRVAGLDDVISSDMSDYEKVREISAWAHGLWEHQGDAQVDTRDPITLILQARESRAFRCVEYAIVIAACLSAVGIPSRTLGLMMRDVETRSSSAGHVVAEAYLRDLDKWIMVDGQWDAIPWLGGSPLNAVELQHAIAARARVLSIDSSCGTEAREYVRWVTPYLYYFSIYADLRAGESGWQERQVILVPVGAKEPTVFQRTIPIDAIYTRNLATFYQPPIVGAKQP
ncbi:MAG: transglutaminase-like domain-containing protein [Candidatus Bipolaricaulota bacterium]